MMEKWDLFKILAGLLRFLVSSIMSLEIEKDQIRDMFMQQVNKERQDETTQKLVQHFVD